MGTRLAVLGHPIAHSLSPKLHAAAYDVLGLDWEYEIADVTEAGLEHYIGSRGPEWRGLSLTMPLKRTVIPILDVVDPLVALTGSANTVRYDHEGHDRTLVGFNTDVAGIQAAFGDAGVNALDSIHIVGGGATAASALIAAGRMGATRALVSVRTPANADRLAALGAQVGVDVTVRNWLVQDRSLIIPDAVVSTLPGGTELPFTFPVAVREGAALLDVAYDPWPSELASSWLDAGGTVVPGLRMLVHQALAQVKIFVGGTPDTALPDESAVRAAMFAGVGL